LTRSQLEDFNNEVLQFMFNCMARGRSTNIMGVSFRMYGSDAQPLTMTVGESVQTTQIVNTPIRITEDSSPLQLLNGTPTSGIVNTLFAVTIDDRSDRVSLEYDARVFPNNANSGIGIRPQTEFVHVPYAAFERLVICITFFGWPLNGVATGAGLSNVRVGVADYVAALDMSHNDHISAGESANRMYRMGHPFGGLWAYTQNTVMVDGAGIDGSRAARFTSVQQQTTATPPAIVPAIRLNLGTETTTIRSGERYEVNFNFRNDSTRDTRLNLRMQWAEQSEGTGGIAPREITTDSFRPTRVQDEWSNFRIIIDRHQIGSTNYLDYEVHYTDRHGTEIVEEFQHQATHWAGYILIAFPVHDESGPASAGTEVVNLLVSDVTVQRSMERRVVLLEGERFPVTFENNFPSGGYSTQHVLEGRTATRPSDPVRTGWHLVDWRTSADDGVTLAPTAFDFNTLITAPITLYANWERNVHNVEFRANGGGGSMSPQAFTFGVAGALNANTFSFENHVFVGWSRTERPVDSPLAPDFSPGQNITDSETLSSTFAHGGTTILHAMWQSNPYFVQFNANGGGGTMTPNPQGRSTGAITPLNLNTFTWAGHEFVGWSRDVARDVDYAGNPDFTDGQTPAQPLSTVADATVQLFAIWRRATYGAPTVVSGAGAPITVTGGLTGGTTGNVRHDDDILFSVTVGEGYSQKWNATEQRFDGLSITVAIAGSTFTAPVQLTISGVTRVITFRIPGEEIVGAVTITTAGWNTTTDLNQYTVTFNVNTAPPDSPDWSPNTHTLPPNAPASVLVRHGERLLTRPASPVHSVDGWRFLGWYANPEFTLRWFFDAVDEVVTEDRSIFARWTDKEIFTVQFDRRGDDGIWHDQTQTVEDGGYANMPPALVKTGFNFLGWSLSPTAVVADFNFVTTQITAANTNSAGVMTLFAVLIAIPYDITFHLREGSGVSETGTTYTIEAPFNLPTSGVMERAGYVFAGWFLTEAAAIALTSVPIVRIEAGTFGPREFWAGWTPVTFSVRFNSNHADATGAMPNQTFIFGTTQALDANGFSRAGHVLAGWARTETGEVEFDDEEEVSNLSDVHGGIVDLFARWVIEPFDIHYFNVDPTGAANLPFVGTHGENHPTSHRIDRPTELVEPTRSLWRFMGWFLTRDGSGDAVDELTDEHFSDDWNTYGVRLYALWQQIPTFAVTFNANQGTGTTPAQHVLEGDFATEPAQSQRPSREGFEFQGWSLTQSGEPFELFDFVDTAITGAITLFARWGGVTFNIFYHNMGYGAVMPSGAPTTFDTGSLPLTLPTAANGVARTNYEFLGWSVDPEFSDIPITAIPIGTTSDVHLWAWWMWSGSGARTLSVSFDLNFEGAEAVPSQNVQVGGFITAPVLPQRPGYRFDGWFENAAGTGTEFSQTTPVPGFTNMFSPPVSLYAKWTLLSFRITFNFPNGGAMPGGTNFIYFTIADLPLTLPAPDAFGDRVFEGWHGSNLFRDSIITELPVGSPLQARFFFAKWVGDPMPFTITLNANGGVLTNPPTIFTSESGSIELTFPDARNGFSFEGWFNNPDFNGGPVFSIPSGTTGDQRFYAKWVPIQPGGNGDGDRAWVTWVWVSGGLLGGALLAVGLHFVLVSKKKTKLTREGG
jgi:uncharacterized repeat protein (TIGR02543 family)